MSRLYVRPYTQLQSTAVNPQLGKPVSWQGGALQQQGQNLFKFDKRKGIRATFDPVTVDRMECEGGPTIYPYGQDLWTSYSLRLWEGLRNLAPWMILGQWHAVDNAQEPGRSPPVALELQPNDVLKFITRHDDNLLSNGNVSPIATTHYTGALVRGVWLHVVMRKRFELTTPGLFQAWLNGTQVVDYAGRIGYNDPEPGRGNYFKFGDYAASVYQHQISQFANVEWGTADLGDRIANPLPIPA